MIPNSAKETTEQVTSALKSFYSNAAYSLQCSDVLLIPSECAALNRDDDITLDWRANSTMSDLTLIVYDGRGSASYHVHTLLMAFGGRKSGFVAEQLKQQQKKNSQLKEYKVEIYVPPLAASYMPLFLDYIYGGILDLSTDNAPSLRYLSNRFDVHELHAQITKQFLSHDLELSTAPKYCMAADQLKDYDLRDMALRIMAERMERMDARFLKDMTPRLMRSLVQCEKIDCGSVILSEKIAQWLRCRDGIEHDDGAKARKVENVVFSDNKPQNSSIKRTNSQISQPILPLSDEDFYWIIHVQQIPQISEHEALFYLNYGSKYPSVMNEVGPGSLKHRCLAAYVSSWAVDNLVAHLEHPERFKLGLYQNLDNELKVQLLESALVSSRKHRHEQELQSAIQQNIDLDVSASNKMMHEHLTREHECPSISGSDKIVVLGCGIPTANGIYMAYNYSLRPISSPKKPSLRSSTATTYEKHAMYNGSQCTFLLAPFQSGKYYTHYKLCIQQNNHTKVLYSSPTFTGEMCIPEQGWEVENADESSEEHVFPAPLFVGRVVSSSLASKS